MKTVSQNPEPEQRTTRIWPPLVFAAVFALWLLTAHALAGGGLGDGSWRWSFADMAAGSYLTLFIVHVVLFIIVRAYRVNLLFALACLVMSLFTVTSHGGYVLSAFASVFERLQASRFIYLTPPVIGALSFGIVSMMFPGVIQKWPLRTAYALMAVLAALFIVIGDGLLGWVLWGFVGVFGAASLYFAVRLVIMLPRIDFAQTVFLMGALIFLHSAIGDVLFQLDVSSRFLSFLFPFISNGLFAEYTLVLFSRISAVALLIATARATYESGGEKHRVAAQEIIAQNQLDFQREQYGQLMVNVESVRYMRHDMKHHLAVISEYAEAGNMAGIRGYMEGLVHGLSAARGKTYCDNYAVNAIVTHYLSLADSDGVEVKIKLTVPVEAGQVKDSDLCVIVGNLLENAVEACRNVGAGMKFIRLFSYAQEDTLTFTMENSYDGDARALDESFYSRKREGKGIGLSSVRAVAAKYGGGTKFEARGRMFISSVYVLMY